MISFFILVGRFPEGIVLSVSSSLVDDRLCILHKVVNQNGPGSLRTLYIVKVTDNLYQIIHLLIVVPEVIIDSRCKVQKEVPGVFRNGSFMMFLEECVPQVKELESLKKGTLRH